ncbi:hypothetical protein ACOI1H_24810 [Loktanella sp. DJP18]|uniref:hypothetical protein n=1 Tax=Loktanella sp. DJP18 TaxID=3409788 RepID=UPI003BB6CB07
MSQEMQTANPTMSQAPAQTIIHVHAGKSAGIAILLTVLLGPLGMFYSTIVGGIVMLIVSFVVAFLTFGLGLLLTWPICIIWAAIAAKSDGPKTITT